MADKLTEHEAGGTVAREQLVALLNEDLSREYQAIIAYVVYSQVLKGAAYMNIAAELAVHATEELSHALTIAKLIDYLGGMPTVTPLPVKVSEKAGTCFASTWRARTKRSATTASGSANARRSASMPWPSTFGTSL